MCDVAVTLPVVRRIDACLAVAGDVMAQDAVSLAINLGVTYLAEGTLTVELAIVRIIDPCIVFYKGLVAGRHQTQTD